MDRLRGGQEGGPPGGRAGPRARRGRPRTAGAGRNRRGARRAAPPRRPPPGAPLRHRRGARQPGAGALRAPVRPPPDAPPVADARVALEDFLARARLSESARADLAEAQRLASEAEAASGKDDHETALARRREALDLRVRALGPDAREVSLDWNRVGLALLRLGRPDEARACFEKDLAISLARLGPRHPDVAIARWNLGFCAEGRGDLAAAATEYRAAVEVRRALEGGAAIDGPEAKETNAARARLEAVLERTAAAADRRATSPAATLAAEEVLALRTARLGPADWRTVDARWSLETLRRRATFGEDERAVWGRARSFGEEADRRWNVREWKEAAAAREEQVRLLAALLGENPAVARETNRLGVLYGKTGEPERERACYERAFGLLEATLPEPHPDLARVLHNLGLAWDEAGDLDRATSALRRAVAQRTAICAVDPDAVSPAARDESVDALLPLLDRRAVRCEDLGDDAGTEAALEEALDLRRQRRGEAHSETADASLALSSFQRRRDLPAPERRRLAEARGLAERAARSLRERDWPEVVRLGERAVEVHRSVLGEEDLAVVKVLQDMAVACARLEQWARADLLCSKALHLAVRLLPEAHPRLAWLHTSIAWVAGRLEDDARAEEHARRAVEMCRAYAGPSEKPTLDALDALADVLEQKAARLEGRLAWEGAKAAREEVLRLRSECWSPAHAKAVDAALALRDLEVRRSFPPEALRRLAEADAAEARAVEAARTDRPADAVVAAEAALAATEAVLGPTCRAGADRAHRLGNVLDGAGRPAEGVEMLRRADAARRRLYGSAWHPDLGLVANDLGAGLEHAGRPDEAEASYRRALEVYARAVGARDARRIRTLSNLAGLLGRRARSDLPDDPERARARAAEAADLWSQARGGESPEAAEARADVALAERWVALPPEARARLVDADADRSLGLVADGSGEWDEAAARLGKALAAYEADLGPDFLRTAEIRAEYAAVRETLGDPADARGRLEVNVERLRTGVGAGHPATARALHALGCLVASLGDLPAGRLALEGALALRRPLLGKDHADTRATADALERVRRAEERPGEVALLSVRQQELLQRSRERLTEARAREADGAAPEGLDLAQRALDLARRAGPWAGDAVADAATAVADLARRTGDSPAARAAREEALLARERVRGPGDWRTVDARLALAEEERWAGLDLPVRVRLAEADALLAEAKGLRAERRGGEAEERAVRALAVRREVLGPRDCAVADALEEQVNDRIVAGREAEAVLPAEEALSIRREALGEMHPAVTEALDLLGVARHEAGDEAGAREALEISLRVHRALDGEESESVARVESNLSIVEAALGRPDAARDLAERALGRRRRIHGDDHPLTAFSWNALGLLRQQAGDLVGAGEAFRRALAIWQGAGPGGPTGRSWPSPTWRSWSRPPAGKPRRGRSWRRRRRWPARPGGRTTLGPSSRSEALRTSSRAGGRSSGRSRSGAGSWSGRAARGPPATPWWRGAWRTSRPRWSVSRTRARGRTTSAPRARPGRRRSRSARRSARRTTRRSVPPASPSTSTTGWRPSTRSVGRGGARGASASGRRRPGSPRAATRRRGSSPPRRARRSGPPRGRTRGTRSARCSWRARPAGGRTGGRRRGRRSWRPAGSRSSPSASATPTPRTPRPTRRCGAFTFGDLDEAGRIVAGGPRPLARRGGVGGGRRDGPPAGADPRRPGRRRRARRAWAEARERACGAPRGRSRRARARGPPSGRRPASTSSGSWRSSRSRRRAGRRSPPRSTRRRTPTGGTPRGTRKARSGATLAALGVLWRRLPDRPTAAGRVALPLARALRDAGRAAASRELLTVALEHAQRLVGDDHPWTAQILFDLGRCESDRGDPDAARLRMEVALASYERQPEAGDDVGARGRAGGPRPPAPRPRGPRGGAGTSLGVPRHAPPAGRVRDAPRPSRRSGSSPGATRRPATARRPARRGRRRCRWRSGRGGRTTPASSPACKPWGCGARTWRRSPAPGPSSPGRSRWRNAGPRARRRASRPPTGCSATCSPTSTTSPARRRTWRRRSGSTRRSTGATTPRPRWP